MYLTELIGNLTVFLRACAEDLVDRARGALGDARPVSHIGQGIAI
jgi:hypothetical protein